MKKEILEKMSVEDLKSVIEEADRGVSDIDEQSKKMVQSVECRMEKFIEDEDVSFVSALNMLVIPNDEESKYDYIKPEAFRTENPSMLKGRYQEDTTSQDTPVMKTYYSLFEEKLEEMERTYRTATYSFDDVRGKTLNLLRRDKWLKPLDDGGEPHKIFSTLIKSLGGGKEENIEHIEKVLTYKYLHPEDHTIPVLTFSGEGGVGKNVLVDVVLNAVYNGAVSSVMGSDILGEFNSIMEGQMVVFVDEVDKRKVALEKLKHSFGQKYFNVNRKNVPAFRSVMTALPIVGSNSKDGALRMDDDFSTRRWSVLICPLRKTLAYWVEQDFGVKIITTDTGKCATKPKPKLRVVDDNFDIDENELEENDEDKPVGYLGKYIKVLGDPTEVRRWLHYLVNKWGHQNHTPAPLHSRDMASIKEAQKSTEVEVYEDVFRDKRFTYISIKDLYDIVRLRVEKEDASSLKYVSLKNVRNNAKCWAEANIPSVVFRSRTEGGSLGVGTSNATRKKVTGFCSFEVSHDMIEKNTDRYYDKWLDEDAGGHNPYADREDATHGMHLIK